MPSRVQQAQDQLGEGDDSKLHQDKDDVVDEEHAEVCGPRYQNLKRFSNQPTENQKISQPQSQTTAIGRIGPAWPYSPVKSDPGLSPKPAISVTAVARK